MMMMAVTKDIENGASYRPRHRTAGALLFLGHLLETIVQIFVCYHYFDGFPRWAGGLTAILLGAVLIVNLASIVGVQQSLDFADRCFGQCLCYTMHLGGLGLVWRYLKLAMLYDYADLKEFALLRFIQVHLQTLPSLLLQASLIYQGQEDGWQWPNLPVTVIPMLLVVLQLISVTVTLVCSTIVLMPQHVDYTQNYCHKTLINWCPPAMTTLSGNKNKLLNAPAFWRDCEEGLPSASLSAASVSHTTEGDCFTLPITTVKSFSLLACRLIAVAVFMMEFHVWTLIIFGVHWCITLLWLVVQDSPSEMDIATPVASLCRRVVVAYLLVFDWPSASYNAGNALFRNRADETTANLPKATNSPTTTTSLLDILVDHEGSPRTVAMAIYYGVVGLENAVMVSLWFQFASLNADDDHALLVRLGTLAFCVATYTIGIFCVLVSTKGCQSPNEKETPTAGAAGFFDLQGDVTSMQIEPPLDKQSYMRSNLKENPADASSLAVTQALVHQHQHLLPPLSQHLHHHSISPNHPPPPVPITYPYLLPNTNNNVLAPAYAATDLHWEEEHVREDDESSNSRNTNTLDGALGSANGGSGLALGISPSPPVTPRRPNLSDPSTKASKLGLSRLALQSTEYRDRTGSFTGSQSSLAGLASLARKSSPLLLHHKPRCSTPKKQRRRPKASLQPSQPLTSLSLSRQASSTDSLVTIPPRVVAHHSRTYKCYTKKRHQRRRRKMCQRSRPCHCRIFDRSEQVGFGLLVQEKKFTRGDPAAASTLPATSVLGAKLSNNNHRSTVQADDGLHHQGRQLRIFCASCLEAHDPLLTHCAQCRHNQVSTYKSQTLPSRHPATLAATDDAVMNGMQMARRYGVYNMDYPSDTELTAGLSRQSVVSSSDSLDSEATYTTWPPPRQTSTNNVLTSSRAPCEAPSWSYVQSWLMNSGGTTATRNRQTNYDRHHHQPHSLRKRRRCNKTNSRVPPTEQTMKAPVSCVKATQLSTAATTTIVNPLSCAVYPHAHSTLYKSKLLPPSDPIERLSAIVV